MSLSPAPQALRLAALNKSTATALMDACGNTLLSFALAQIAALQADSQARGEGVQFDQDSRAPSGKPWQTFQNHIEPPGSRVKGLVSPVTITAEAKAVLATLFVSLANLVRACRAGAPCLERLGTDEGLADQSKAENLVTVRFLLLLADERAGHLFRQDPLCRDFGSAETFQLLLCRLISSKSPHSGPVRLFVGFLRLLGWHTGVRAYENGRAVINLKTLYTMLFSLEACVDGGQAAAAGDGFRFREAIHFLRERANDWCAAKQRLREASSAAKLLRPPAAKPPAAAAAPAAAADANAAPVAADAANAAPVAAGAAGAAAAGANAAAVADIIADIIALAADAAPAAAGAAPANLNGSVEAVPAAAGAALAAAAAKAPTGAASAAEQGLADDHELDDLLES